MNSDYLNLFSISLLTCFYYRHLRFDQTCDPLHICQTRRRFTDSTLSTRIKTNSRRETSLAQPESLCNSTNSCPRLPCRASRPAPWTAAPFPWLRPAPAGLRRSPSASQHRAVIRADYSFRFPLAHSRPSDRGCDGYPSPHCTTNNLIT